MGRVFGVVACFALCGCSILLDSGDHQGGGAQDAAVPDGSSDSRVASDSDVDQDAQLECTTPEPIENIAWRTCTDMCRVCSLSTTWLENQPLPGTISNGELSMEIVESSPPNVEQSVYLAFILGGSPLFETPHPIIIDALAPQATGVVDLVQIARNMGAAEMARYDSVAIGAITEEKLGFVVVGAPAADANPRVWVGYAGTESILVPLNPSATTGTVFGRAAVTLGGEIPRAYWRERNNDEEFELGSVDLEAGAGKSFNRYAGSLVSESDANVEVVGSDGALVITESRMDETLLVWNGDSGEPETIAAPDRTSPPTIAYLGNDRYFVGWLEENFSTDLTALQLRCPTACAGGTCTRTRCCTERMVKHSLGALAPESIAAHALPEGGVVVVFDEGEASHGTVDLMFLDDTFAHLKVGNLPTYSVMAAFAGVDSIKGFQVGILEDTDVSAFDIIVALTIGVQDGSDAMGVQVARISVCQ